jgi:serine/threonine protein kinase/Tol biopolymer transport system component
MDGERWRQIEEVFQSALERTPEERPAFLLQACGNDRDLREQVESLLGQSSDSGPLDRPAWQLADCSFGPYRVVERIGAGGMGQVFRAVDTRLNRTVALKLLLQAFANRPDFRRRFEREARACSSLNHPHVCSLYDVGDQDGQPYLVMEYVSGETLAERLRKGRLPLRQAVEYGAQIAGALAAAHKLGIVHRDLKPANIMLTAAGVKVLDFGLAKIDRPLGRSAESTATLSTRDPVLGTLAYMSPEHLEGKECDTRSDIFALGLVLHEMAAGVRPFAAESTAALIAEILRGEPAPLSGVPPRFAQLVRRCLMRDPARRWQSASDVQIELEESLSAPFRARVNRRQVLVLSLWPASVVAAGWIGAALRRDPAAVNLSRYRLTPFAAARHMQANPLWSPDGRKIAFVGQESGTRFLYVQAIDSATAVGVTGPDLDVTAFFPGVWSPDSQSLYFTGTRDGQTGIFRVPASGGEVVLVQPDALRGAISPDGRALVTLAQTAEGFRIFIASIPGSPPRPDPLAPFEAGQWKGRPFLAFAPDGRKLLVVVDTETRREAWLLEWPPGKSRRVFEQAMLGPAPQFAWMPDSRHVVVAAAPPGSHSQLYLADTDTGRYWPILAQDRPVTVPSVSPDGTRVAYQSSLSTSEVIAVPLDGRPSRTLLGGARSQQMADHSAVGQQLVYVTDRRGVPEVWITSLADNSERLLLSPGDIRIDAEPAVGFAAPSFSRDGRRVAVVASTPVGGAIYTTPAAGTMPVRATEQKNPSEYGPTWSPDGRWLAFWHISGRETRLAKVKPGSGEGPVDLAKCWNRTVPAWSPSGDWIAYHDSSPQLALVSPDGKARRALGGTGAIAWAPDGKTLYQARSDTHELVAIDPDTGRERAVRELGEMLPYSSLNAGWRASFTPDGSEFVYTINHPREEIWILDGIHAPAPWYRSRWPF